jgi:hypothetical protein
MKPEKRIVAYDSCSNTLKVGKRNSFMNEDNKIKHRTSSFRFKQSETNIIKNHDTLDRCSDLSQEENKQSFTANSQIITTQIKELPEELIVTPEKKQPILIPHLKQRRKTSSSKLNPIVTISPEECQGVIKKMETPFQREESKSNNPIQPYCSPNPFSGFDQAELEEMVANIKMPEAKHSKDNFRKIYKEHVVQTLQSICLIKTIKCPSDEEISKKVAPLAMPPNSNKITRN